MTLIIELFLYLLSLYLIFGVAFGVYFIIYGASKIDPILAETRKRVRILLIPGIIAVWPVFFYHLFRNKPTRIATLGLKRTHLIIWSLLIFIVSSFIYKSLEQTDFTKKNNLIEKFVKNESYIENDLIAISKDSNTLFIKLKKPIKSASSLVYTCDVQGNKILLLGQVDRNKAYNFKIEDDIQGVLIFDSIKTKTITKLLFP